MLVEETVARIRREFFFKANRSKIVRELVRLAAHGVQGAAIWQNGIRA